MSAWIVATTVSRGITPPDGQPLPLLASFRHNTQPTPLPCARRASPKFTEEHSRPRVHRAAGPPKPPSVRLPCLERRRLSVELLGRATPWVRTANPPLPSLPSPVCAWGPCRAEEASSPSNPHWLTRPRPSPFADSGHGTPRRARAGGRRRSRHPRPSGQPLPRRHSIFPSEALTSRHHPTGCASAPPFAAIRWSLVAPRVSTARPATNMSLNSGPRSAGALLSVRPAPKPPTRSADSWA